MLFAAPAAAQEENHAGLIVVHGDSSVTQRCVAFTEESVSGAELLTRSGLDLSVEASSMGATVCRIDGEGCSFPQQSCFCQCEGSPCVYWSYWRLTHDEWRYSNIGAGGSIVRHGDVDGWRWGLGTVDKAEAPPTLTFEEICADALALADNAAESTTPEAPGDELVTVLPATEESQSNATAASTPIVMSTATNSARQSLETDAVTTPFAALITLLGVVIALPLLGLLIVVLRRAFKRQRP